MRNAAPAHTTMFACPAAPARATTPIFTTASARNAALLYTTMPACIGLVEGACTRGSAAEAPSQE
eukprot:6512473-Pyramimonas_sp.AAC.1